MDNLLSRTYNQEEIELFASKTNVSSLEIRLKNLKQKLKLDYQKQSLLRSDKIRLGKLLEKGVISKQEYEVVSIKEYQGKQNINDTKSEIGELRFQMINSSRNLKLNTAKLYINNQSLYRVLSHSFNQLKVAIKDWENKFLIKASRNGVFSFNDGFYKNEFIKEDVLIGSIINEMNSDPEVHLYASVTNSGKLKIGQQVNIKFDNYDYMEYGIVYGNIYSISNIVNNNKEYLIKVNLKDGLKSSYGKEIPFKNDISCKTDIILERSSFSEKIFYRFKDILLNN